MTEPVRLVIWDLDETFWHGTLTEGGISSYSMDNHNIVIELARRGIMSSICSKNDLSDVKKILVEKDIWDYFIYPSIDWTQKGHRVAGIIESVQLRPETVLFIDDNPSVLAEVKSAVPGIQTASENVIPTILRSALFVGKNDRELSRLKQYKLLESRQEAQKRAGGSDNKEFLRSCNVRVYIETDVEGNIDRAIELINRTNQLNFTKERLPEQIDLAKQELLSQIKRFECQAGLIRVVDNYGDYGYCGIFLLVGHLSGYQYLRHFCFSCRILGMGLEHWMYERLNRPNIKISGEVLTDLHQANHVDWISIVGDPADLRSREPSQKSTPFDEIRFQGGCDVMAIGHYATIDFDRIWSRSNSIANGLFILHNNSLTLLESIRSNGDTQRYAAKIGYGQSHLAENLLAGSSGSALLLWSPGTGDVYLPFYRHKARRDIVLPIASPHYNFADQSPSLDSVAADLARLNLDQNTIDILYATIRESRENWELLSIGLSISHVKGNVGEIFAHIPDGARLFIMLPSRVAKDTNGELRKRVEVAQYVDAISEVAKAFPKVSLLYADDYIESPNDIEEFADHFERTVYHRQCKALISSSIEQSRN